MGEVLTLNMPPTVAGPLLSASSADISPFRPQGCLGKEVFLLRRSIPEEELEPGRG